MEWLVDSHSECCSGGILQMPVCACVHTCASKCAFPLQHVEYVHTAGLCCTYFVCLFFFKSHRVQKRDRKAIWYDFIPLL